MGQTLDNPALLHRAGVKIAICTDHPETPIQYLPLCAAMAVRGGLDPEEALAAITSSAAEIAGLSKRVGTLTPGKDADVVVTSGHLSQRPAGQIISLGPVRMDRAQAVPYRKMYLSRKTRASIASTGLTFFRLSAPVKRWTAT